MQVLEIATPWHNSRAHHIIKSIPYQDHWRHWRHQLATVANNEKQAWRGRIAGETVNASAELSNLIWSS